ncbi:hypothetical protein M427DRAFT_69698 [Gonapodya prolifera JEL478]|uniref:Uncharacterized protein n=1 Tax=Gonapodya prolifera (strain JEL478) TaxID=1344416 RepID=A0A139AH62_GONPJ|nr:hypothetical protein M427DRAFT_69698 [Gonapodya prolifera JEL478]|eukprot:KXS16039.1 hypothetical protein M427DRAFT_69698 [Gonapodya prolifera JEL478]
MSRGAVDQGARKRSGREDDFPAPLRSILSLPLPSPATPTVPYSFHNFNPHPSAMTPKSPAPNHNQVSPHPGRVPTQLDVLVDAATNSAHLAPAADSFQASQHAKAQSQAQAQAQAQSMEQQPKFIWHPSQPPAPPPPRTSSQAYSSVYHHSDLPSAKRSRTDGNWGPNPPTSAPLPQADVDMSPTESRHTQQQPHLNQSASQGSLSSSDDQESGGPNLVSRSGSRRNVHNLSILTANITGAAAAAAGAGAEANGSAPPANGVQALRTTIPPQPASATFPYAAAQPRSAGPNGPGPGFPMMPGPATSLPSAHPGDPSPGASQVSRRYLVAEPGQKPTTVLLMSPISATPGGGYPHFMSHAQGPASPYPPMGLAPPASPYPISAAPTSHPSPLPPSTPAPPPSAHPTRYLVITTPTVQGDASAAQGPPITPSAYYLPPATTSAASGSMIMPIQTRVLLHPMPPSAKSPRSPYPNSPYPNGTGNGGAPGQLVLPVAASPLARLGHGELPPKAQLLAAVDALYETHAGLKRAREEVEEVLRSHRTRPTFPTAPPSPPTTAAGATSSDIPASLSSSSSSATAAAEAHFNALSRDLWAQVQGALREVDQRLKTVEARCGVERRVGAGGAGGADADESGGDMDVETKADVDQHVNGGAR